MFLSSGKSLLVQGLSEFYKCEHVFKIFASLRFDKMRLSKKFKLRQLVYPFRKTVKFLKSISTIQNSYYATFTVLFTDLFAPGGQITVAPVVNLHVSF